MMIIAFSKICQVQMYRLFFLFNKQIIFFYLIILFFWRGAETDYWGYSKCRSLL